MPNSSPPRPGAQARRSVRRGLAAGTVIGLTLMYVLGTLAAGPALADANTASATAHATFATAWRAGSAESIAAGMESEGSATFRLLEYPLEGRARSMKPEQAKVTLKAYFKRLGGIHLADVTPERGPENVRLYDFTYKPTGESARTTRLHVQLKQDGNRPWVLASVTESPKPRK